MANDTGKITGAINQAGVNLTEAMRAEASNINSAISNNANTIANKVNPSLNAIKDGVVLNEDIAAAEDLIVEELNGLGSFLKEKVAGIMNIMNQVYQIQADPEGNADIVEAVNAISEGDEEERKNNAIIDTGDINVNTSTVGDLKGAKSQVGVFGTGFAMLGNMFTVGLADIVKNLQPLQQIQMATNNQVTMAEAIAKERAQPKEDDSGKAKGNFRSFLQDLVGPLESVATGIMMLAISFVALSLVPLNAQAALTFAALCGSLVVVFWSLNKISKQYQDAGLNQALDDKDKKQPGNIFGILESFAKMVFLMAVTYTLMSFVSSALLSNWPSLLVGLVLTMGVMVGSIFAMKALAQIALPEVDPQKGGALPTLVNSVAKLVLLVVTTAIVCELLWPIILPGLDKALLIFLLVAGMTVGIIALTAKIKEADPELVNAISKLMMQITIMVGAVAILTIILGLLPESILIQGMIGMGLIIAMVNLTLWNVIQTSQKLAEIDEKKIKDLTNLMIVITAMVTVTSILVMILGYIPIENIIQGIVSVTLIALLPRVMIQMFKDIPQEEVAQALVGVLAASLIVVAVAGLAWLITNMMPDPTSTIIAITAVLTMAIAMYAIGQAASALATMANVLLTTFPPFGLPIFATALLGLALVMPLVIAIAATGILVTQMILSSGASPEQVLVSAMATLVLAAAFSMIATTALLLAAVAIPLFFAIGLALFALGSIVSFMKGVAVVMQAMSELPPLDVSPIAETAEQIVKLLAAVVLLVPPMITLAGFAVVLLVTTFLAKMALLTTFSFIAGISLSMFTLNYTLQTLNFEAVSESIGNTMNDLVGIIANMSKASDTIAKYKSMGFFAYLNVMADISRFRSIIKGVSSIGSNNENMDGLNSLATSLEKLASTSDGLSQVARALKEVAAATKELNEVGDINIKHSVSNIAKTTEDVTQIKTPEAPKEKKDDGNSKVIEGLLREMVQALGELRGSFAGSMEGLNTTMIDIKRNLEGIKASTELR